MLSLKIVSVCFYILLKKLGLQRYTFQVNIEASGINLNWFKFTALETDDEFVPVWVGDAPPDNDFETVSIDTGINEPMEIDISKNGDLYVIGRQGDFYALEDNELVKKSEINTNAVEIETGLIGFALDPNFTTNRFAYFHYLITILEFRQ